ncbi:MAG TPA: hypothetical protein VHY84_24470 [Bryobacteraceae bacterium]|jgi:hypothetical protein|nr:hypothetical protein [Bryobacteraceae bacterium]
MFGQVKLAVLPIFLLSLSSAVAQQPDQHVAAGVIYGVVIGNDGSPAGEIRLTASPLGVALATRLPETRTDQSGNYRFERIPWWGEYIVYADDPDAGYSVFSTGPAGPGEPPEAIISPEHPEARLDLRLPQKAGFLRIHLTDQRTGAVISGLNVAVMSSQTPSRIIFSESCGSDGVVLIPPNKDLAIHITSPGFHEWDESAGRGKAIRMPPRESG